MTLRHRVAIYRSGVREYPVTPPFHPPVEYPEYPFGGHGMVDASNAVYAAVREAFALLGLDRAHLGSREWNPLGEYIRPGDRVLIKPNLVRHFHRDGLPLESVVVHGSVIRALLDFVLIALRGDGEIIVGDAPLQQGHFEEITRQNGLREVVAFIQANASVPVRLVDFRLERAEKDQRGRIVARIPLLGDPLGQTAVNVGQQSFLAPVQDRYRRFRVTNYDPNEMTRHHNQTTHEYLITNSVLQADVILNVPKLKTHKKAGITAAMKNMVGINASKDWLPHHTVGSRSRGGDQYLRPSWRKRLRSFLLDVIEAHPGRPVARVASLLYRGIIFSAKIKPFPCPYWEGNWYGNDTIWRTVLDLNRIALYANRQGKLTSDRQRKIFTLIDGIIAGEGEGPTAPKPRPAGVIIAGEELACIDYVAALLMGFSPEAIPTVRFGLASGLFGPTSPDQIEIVTNVPEWRSLSDIARHNLHFEPPPGWKGHVELGHTGEE